MGMTVSDKVALDFSDVLLKPQIGDINSRTEVNPYWDNPHSNRVAPIIAANMDNIGTFEVARVLSPLHCLTALHKHYSVEQLLDFFNNEPYNAVFTILSTGTSEQDIQKLKQVLSKTSIEPWAICLDVANAYTPSIQTAMSSIREFWPKPNKLMVGNVCTLPGIGQLRSNADYFKVGIGPGSACDTRKMTGIGYPQLSAILECSDEGRNKHLIADGGITCPGDMVKAIAAGAEFVMIGGQFAGHDETGTQYYGMASKKAQEIHNGGLQDYRASEGREYIIKPRGSLTNTVNSYINGLRSAMTYMGMRELYHLQGEGNFIRVNNQLNRSLDKDAIS